MDRTPEAVDAAAGAQAQTHVYEPNPKHKLPWARGRRGSLCPPVDAQGLLDVSEVSAAEPSRRYATDGRSAFCGVQHAPGRWHGYPVGWKEVPGALRQKWLNEGRVRRSDMRAFWDKTP